jgi:hypothetical protein
MDSEIITIRAAYAEAYSLWLSRLAAVAVRSGVEEELPDEMIRGYRDALRIVAEEYAEAMVDGRGNAVASRDSLLSLERLRASS